MGLFDRWFGQATTDPTVAARQRSAAWGVFLAAQRAALPPRPVETVPMVVDALAPARSPMAAPVMAPSAPSVPASSSRTTAAPTTVLVIEDGEEVV